MYISKSFIPILKDNPSEAKIKSHQLMLRVGMIKQSSAGIYSWLPLGFKVMKKIEKIVREEQDKIGAQEILMPTIQPSDIWKESGRYDDYGEEMLRIKIAKIERCFMDLPMKNWLLIYLDHQLNLISHYLNYFIIFNGNLEMK